MSAERGFSLSRWWSIVLKEFLQLRRDRLTFGMIIGIPIMQLLLFGYAINTNPKHLPTAIVAADDSIFTRGVIAALKNSDYFELRGQLPDEASGREALARGDVLFVLNIPSDFTRRLLHGDKPSLLIEADATDPSATGLASAAVSGVAQGVIARDLTGALSSLATASPAFDIQVHSLYNPESNSQFNIVPGLMGVILTMTMVLMTGLAMTRERERGTMENLLATPVKPVEVVTGKIVPYIAIGLIQATIILLAARFVFSIPFVGSVLAIYLCALLFVAATLSVGITLSSLAQNQLQAMQMTMFYFLPNILLSGFMFPFQGMPAWARAIGNVLPLTHFNRLIRGIVLKGNGWLELWPNIWPMGLFALVMLAIALKFYRRTLD
jgi:ABC-2 type transport system permease protein